MNKVDRIAGYYTPSGFRGSGGDQRPLPHSFPAIPTNKEVETCLKVK